MNKTKIEWCDATWNPVTGCLHGCEYCYARKIANRFSNYDGSYVLTSNERNAGTASNPLFELEEKRYKHRNDDKPLYLPYPFCFEPTLHKYRLDEPARKARSRNIFVCSMADLFGEWVPDEWIKEVFEACKAAPQHRYLFLTKNPKRYCTMAGAGRLPKEKNFWYGTTITKPGDAFFGGRISDNIYLSIEPLIEPLDAGLGSFGAAKWIILGAETGNSRGKVTPRRDWVENILDAAAITQIPVFMKDSLLPIMGEENMRREFPWEGEQNG